MRSHLKKNRIFFVDFFSSFRFFSRRSKKKRKVAETNVFFSQLPFQQPKWISTKRTKSINSSRKFEKIHRFEKKKQKIFSSFQRDRLVTSDEKSQKEIKRHVVRSFRFNLMTYDFHGGWDQNKAHHSSLNSKDNEKDDTSYIVRLDFQFSSISFSFFIVLSLGFRCKIFSKIRNASE